MKETTRRKQENTNQEDRITCKICGKNFAHLGSHIWHKHKILAKEYKEEFGLPYNFALISKTVYIKKSEAFQERKEEFLNNLIKGGKKHRFFKGQVMPKNQYRSKTAIENSLKNLNTMNNNKWENCPVCNIKYKHLDSHLYNKHKLIRIKQ
jgi:hypothetical protein